MFTRMTPLHAGVDEEYRPMSIPCVLALALGCVSPGAFLTPVAVVLALSTVVFSLVAIRRAGDELTGVVYAKTGLVFALVAVTAGPALHIYQHRQEVPRGFQVVSFRNDITRKPAMLVDGRVIADPSVERLIGTSICLRGRVIPPQQSTQLDSFLLTSSLIQSGFGAQYDANEAIGIVLRPGHFFDFTGEMISVTGELSTVEQTSLDNVPFYILKNAEVCPATSQLVGIRSSL